MGRALSRRDGEGAQGGERLTPEAEKHNQGLLKRQEVLASAWKAYVGTNPSDDKFTDGWMKARAAALKAANLDVIFE